jgi:hypothetical protein
METFYHDIKEHMSPSAMAQWMHQRSAFIRSYFEGERTPETAAMRGGTAIHRLIEGGMFPAKHIFDLHEEEIRVPVPGSGFFFMGKPDSRDEKATKGVARFVDYKSGKANDWKAKLPIDIKMKATAWLVWQATGCPEKVVGSIEFIQTTWDPEAKEVVPLEGVESDIIECTYLAQDLEAFTKVIIKTMGDVNDFFERWKNASGEFVSDEDTQLYEGLAAKKEAIEAEIEEVKERIMGQMEFGGVLNHKTAAGTFYITEKKEYSYPDELIVRHGDEEHTLKEVEEIAASAKAAKKNFELTSEPISTATTIGFRKASKKKGAAQ